MAFYDEPVFQPRNFQRAIEAQVPQKFLRDRWNRLRFGETAPKSDECIFIRPADVTRVYRRKKGAFFKRRHSGQIRGGDWDISTRALSQSPKYQACVAHFKDGKPWQETGVFQLLLERIQQHGIFDGCRSLDDIRQRYENMDRLFDDLKKTRQIQSMSERDEYFRREHGGVFVHIDRHGLPILAGNGNHRMAIAKILELDWIPAQLGVIHAKAFDDGVLDRLRQKPSARPEQP